MQLWKRLTVLAVALLAAGAIPALAQAPNATAAGGGGRWGGYAYAGGTGSVSASWTVPAVTCNSADDRFSQWVGIDGFGSPSVEQIGTRVTCEYGDPYYTAFSQLYPQEKPVFYEAGNTPVYPGDQMSASVAFVRGGYQRAVTDDTQGWTVTAPASAPNARNASGEVVVEAPTHSYADFGEADFYNATINGQPIGALGAQPVTANAGNGPQAVPGQVDGSAFSVFYAQET